MRKITLLMAFSLCISFLSVSCKKRDLADTYLPLITEMHQIECDALRRTGIKFEVNEKNIYAFRSIAFDKIMTKPEGKLIAHWDDLNQQLAVIEYYLDDSGKEIYQNDFREIYLTQCE